MIEAIMAAKKANGLQVVVTFEGRGDFNYYAKNIADRDAYVAKVTARINKPDVLGHVVKAVTIK